jgi:hypothetical protein
VIIILQLINVHTSKKIEEHMQNYQNQKGFVIPLIIAIVAILTLGGVVLVTNNKKVESPVIVNSNLPAQPTQTSTSTVSCVPEGGIIGANVEGLVCCSGLVHLPVDYSNSGTVTKCGKPSLQDTASEWKTYTNTQYGFSFQYPINAKVEYQDMTDRNDQYIGLYTILETGKFYRAVYLMKNESNISVENYVMNLLKNLKIITLQNIQFNGFSVVNVNSETAEDNERVYFLGLKNVIVKVPVIQTANINDNTESYSTFINSFKSTSASTKFITVLSPNGGESYKVGSQQIIRWNAPISTKTVRIFLESISTHYAGGGVGGYIPDVHIILAQDALNSGSYTTNIPDVATGKYSVLIEGIDNSGKPVVLSDSSDNYFAITSTNSSQTLITIELSVWPDVNSFDLTKQTFQAVNIFDFNACNNPKNPDSSACDRVKNGVKNIKTNSSTIYYYHIDSYKEYHDFNWLYLTTKNWNSTNLPLNIKGVTQNDGSFLASEISMGGQ